MIHTIKSAIFSDDKKYRYLLSRDWAPERPVAMCIGLNPSNADAEEDDPTIRILVNSLNQLGFGGLRMTNLYAYISSKPKMLFEVPDPQGQNDSWLVTTAHGCQEIIFCWGGFKKIEFRAKKISAMFPSGKCFSKNSDGSPMHPMAIMWQGIAKEELRLIKFKETVQAVPLKPSDVSGGLKSDVSS